MMEGGDILDECLICKRHYTQGGKCWENKRNCIHFEEEPRGKVVDRRANIIYNPYAETPIIRKGQIITGDDGREMKITAIHSVDMSEGTIKVDFKIRENDLPPDERKKLFKIIEIGG